ncbi:hypothetical protein [Photobacterium sp. 1_MG-2023]|uniref:hypothetical protein n=1 Tax=Photobacterium sp. 1_MG-2023 TaxID=3062646 RepID=UPI0026E4204E|nr:hypothetical protein [Photobacterium sp. 1_MG-2023]MDO6707565.1 hypothetical protein [Photobacterium sp. 1_MG-2023]
MKKYIAVLLITMIQACSTAENAWERVMILGSAEANDPVLAQVESLEKKGLVKDVNVLESFPVQIWLTASEETIESLKAMPRKSLNDQTYRSQ